mmetsp:Transcript_22545/g.89532  ORF Transcript_22545/g.89532 Transcript_22545/m.89532 type:complete len:371 (-) Transcript_22545:46-1158(-)
MRVVGPRDGGPGGRARRVRVRRVAARRRHRVLRPEGDRRLPQGDGLFVHHARPRGPRLRRVALQDGHRLHHLLDEQGPPPGPPGARGLRPRRHREAPGHQPLAALQEPLRPPSQLAGARRPQLVRTAPAPDHRPRRPERRRRGLGRAPRRPRRRPRRRRRRPRAREHRVRRRRRSRRSRRRPLRSRRRRAHDRGRHVRRLGGLAHVARTRRAPRQRDLALHVIAAQVGHARLTSRLLWTGVGDPAGIDPSPQNNNTGRAADHTSWRWKKEGVPGWSRPSVLSAPSPRASTCFASISMAFSPGGQPSFGDFFFEMAPAEDGASIFVASVSSFGGCILLLSYFFFVDVPLRFSSVSRPASLCLPPSQTSSRA